MQNTLIEKDYNFSKFLANISAKSPQILISISFFLYFESKKWFSIHFIPIYNAYISEILIFRKGRP